MATLDDVDQRVRTLADALWDGLGRFDRRRQHIGRGRYYRNLFQDAFYLLRDELTRDTPDVYAAVEAAMRMGWAANGWYVFAAKTLPQRRGRQNLAASNQARQERVAERRKRCHALKKRNPSATLADLRRLYCAQFPADTPPPSLRSIKRYLST
jgi:hypothetical protein